MACRRPGRSRLNQGTCNSGESGGSGGGSLPSGAGPEAEGGGAESSGGMAKRITGRGVAAQPPIHEFHHPSHQQPERTNRHGSRSVAAGGQGHRGGSATCHLGTPVEPCFFLAVPVLRGQRGASWLIRSVLPPPAGRSGRGSVPAERIGGTTTRRRRSVRPRSDLTMLLQHCDVVVCSTGAQGYVLTREVVQAAMKARRGHS